MNLLSSLAYSDLGKPTRPVMDIKQFHNDLKAAQLLGTPIDLGISKSQLEQYSESVELHEIDSRSDLPKRYVAALKVYEKTGTMVPVLDSLTVRGTARQQISKVLRSTYIYLFLIVTTASVGLWIYADRVVPMIQSMRHDLEYMTNGEMSNRFDTLPYLGSVSILMLAALIVLFLYAVLGGVYRLGMKIGGAQYIKDQIASCTMKTLSALTQAGVGVEEAIELSCDLAGADSQTRNNIRITLSQQDSPENMKTLSSYYFISSSQSMEQLKVATPIALVSVVGGVVGLIYCITIFWPILSLIYDLNAVTA